MKNPMRHPRNPTAEKVDRQSRDEQSLPPRFVGEPPKLQGSNNFADGVDRPGEPDLGGRDVEGVLAAVGGNDLDFQAVKNPRNATTDNHRPVEFGPWQPVHAGGHRWRCLAPLMPPPQLKLLRRRNHCV